MQRLFTMFPAGYPGMGLILLRIAVSLQFLWLVCSGVAIAVEQQWVIAISVLFAALLCIGLLTPAITVLWTLATVLHLSAHVFQHWWLLLISTCSAMALTLLGPGAYSLDAKLFGRRLLRLPDGDED